MSLRFRGTGWTRVGGPIAALVVAALATTRLSDARASVEHEGGPFVLSPARAVGVRVDTLSLGGYAQGSFVEALQVLASDLNPDEQTLVGTHLDKIFAGVLEQDGLGRTGRLRLSFERAVRPDGTTRAIRVLAAEAAVGGSLHTAFYFEREGKPGYFDPFGRSLDPGAWAQPLEQARVSSSFGLRRMHPILRRVLPHSGIDYAAPAGTPVRATGDGIVSVAGPRGGYGLLVEIQHPSGYATRYAHLSSIALRPGVMVRQGEVVGRVGATGLATGPHLHYEVRRNGRAVDPARVAGRAGVPEDLGSEPAWAGERQRLSELLARTPTMVGSR